MVKTAKTKFNKIISILLVMFITLQVFSDVFINFSYAALTDEIIFTDTVLREKVEELANITDGEAIYESDIADANIKIISLLSSGVTSLEGMQVFKNYGLEQLLLNNNQVKDISAISELTSLTVLTLGANQIDDISALSGLVKLVTLNLKGNKIKNAEILETLPLLSATSGMNVMNQDCGVINEGEVKQNSETEISLPPIFAQAKRTGSKLYTEDNFEITGDGGLANNDGSKIILATNTIGQKSITVKIVGGTAAGSTVTINYTVVSNKTQTENQTRVTVEKGATTTISLKNLANGNEYLGILNWDNDLIFKEIPYGEYEVSCINTLDVKTSIIDNQFTLSENNKTQTISVQNENVLKSGFYSTVQKDNLFCVDIIPPEITLLGDDTIVLNAGETYTEIGFKAFDNHDGDITSKVEVTNNITAHIGTYEVVYTVSDWYGNTATVTRTVKVISENFDYTGDYQTFIAPKSGIYKVELWGASGTVSAQLAEPGKGGYVSGNIYLDKGEEIYVYVGESSNDSTKAGSLTFNGGGAGYDNVPSAGRGGGATDVRLEKGNWNSEIGLNSRIMVAGRRRCRPSNCRWRNWRRCRRIRKL